MASNLAQFEPHTAKELVTAVRRFMGESPSDEADEFAVQCLTFLAGKTHAQQREILKSTQEPKEK